MQKAVQQGQGGKTLGFSNFFGKSVVIVFSVPQSKLERSFLPAVVVPPNRRRRRSKDFEGSRNPVDLAGMAFENAQVTSCSILCCRIN